MISDVRSFRYIGSPESLNDYAYVQETATTPNFNLLRYNLAAFYTKLLVVCRGSAQYTILW